MSFVPECADGAYFLVAGKNLVQSPAEKKSPVCRALSTIALVSTAFTCITDTGALPLMLQQLAYSKQDTQWSKHNT